MEFKIYDSPEVKAVKSENYNSYFNKATGLFLRWGKTQDDDPVMAPSSEIADVEITTICEGISTKGNCSYCYKRCASNGNNMSFETFKTVLDCYPKILQQVAFGGDASLTSNPDLWKMMDYCLENGVIPNITCAEISDETADKLADRCGAVASSFHGDKDICYDTVKKLTYRGMKQINIHFVLHEDSYEDALEIIDDIQRDARLQKMNALVFLQMKPKGRACRGFTTISEDKFNNVVSKAFESKINFGFDSCSAPRFMKYIDKFIVDDKQRNALIKSVSACDSSCTSSYINTYGEFFPCSFSEGEGEWKTGIKITPETDFIGDIWMSNRLVAWRNRLLGSSKNCNCSMKSHCKICPVFDITPCFEGKLTGDRASK